MSARENGDFMHFDCRDTELGRAVYSKKAPRDKQVSPTMTPTMPMRFCSTSVAFMLALACSAQADGPVPAVKPAAAKPAKATSPTALPSPE